MDSLLAALHSVMAGPTTPEAPRAPEGGGQAIDAGRDFRLRMPRDRARFRFSNGTLIYRGGSREPIDPRSPEGRTIEAILERQHRDREANARQRERFWAITRGSAVPKAVVEGRAPLSAIVPGPGLTLADLLPKRP